MSPTSPTLRSLPHRLAVLAGSVLAGLAGCLALLAALGGPVPGAQAATAAVFNYPGGAGCTTTLQACLNNVPTGATIVVQPGTYLTNALTLNRAVSLTGVSSATVILHALASQRVLSATGAAVNSSVVISGLTLAGGQALGLYCPEGCGGALLITATAQPRLINLTLRDSSAEGEGGGLFADRASPLVLRGVAVLSNSSQLGGAGIYSSAAISLTSSRLEANQCDISCPGGGLFGEQSVWISGTPVLGNHSGSAGAGVFATGSLSINGGLFQNNECYGDGCAGGGLFSIGTLSVSGTQFLNNRSRNSGGAGFMIMPATLTNVVFQNNQCISACNGGALFAIGLLTATHVSFQSNTSTNGAGAAYLISAARLNDVGFQDNQCTQPVTCVGGGVYALSALSGSGVRFVGNHSLGSGGGIYALSPITLSQALFQDNRCTDAACRGGGIFTLSGLVLTDTAFLGNRADDGGGLFALGGNSRMVNGLFAANQASGHGSALYLASTGAASLLHSTVASPTLGSGAAIYVTSGTVGLTNTLLAGYAIGIENVDGSAREDYSLFSGLGAPFSGTVVSGGHSHTGAAGFANPAAGNYHLARGSAAIDAGINAGISFDADGDPRPIGAGFDIGFDEFRAKLFLPLVQR